jgi:hypothetical protein
MIRISKGDNHQGAMILAMILSLAFILRFIGCGFGLPALYHQDEPIIVNHAVAYSNFDFNPHFFKIPPLLSYLLFFIYGALFGILKIARNFSFQDYAVLFLENPNIFYFVGRLLFGVVAGVASVWVLYRIANLFAGPRTALLASFFFAINFLHVRDSHYLYADIPMIFAILCSIYFLFSFRIKKRPFDWIKASAWAGVALAFKYVAAPVLIPLVWVTSGEIESDGGFKLQLRRGGIALVLAGGIFILLNPYMLIDLPSFAADLRSQAGVEGVAGYLHHALYSLVGGSGMWFSLLGLLGLLWAWKKFRQYGFFWSFPFIYYAMISVFSQPYERYAMPIVPFLCLGTAFFIDAVAIRLRSKRLEGACLACLVALVSVMPLLKSVQLDRLVLRDDTRTMATKWIEKEIPAGAVILLDHTAFSPRLWQTDSQIQDKIVRVGADDPHAIAKTKKLNLLKQIAREKRTYAVYFLNEGEIQANSFFSSSPGVEADLAALKKAGIRYFVRYRYPGESDFFKVRLQKNAKLLQTFSPYKDSHKKYTEDEWANVALPFRSRELFSRNRPGPYLEIYELDKIK